MSDVSEASTFHAGNPTPSLIDIDDEERDETPLSPIGRSETPGGWHVRSSSYFDELIELDLNTPEDPDPERIGNTLGARDDIAEPKTLLAGNTRGPGARTGNSLYIDGIKYEREITFDSDRDSEEEIPGFISGNLSTPAKKIRKKNTFGTSKALDGSVYDNEETVLSRSELAVEIKDLTATDLITTNKLLQDLVYSQKEMCASIAGLASSVKQLVILHTEGDVTTTHGKPKVENLEDSKETSKGGNNYILSPTTGEASPSSKEASPSSDAKITQLNKTITDMQHTHSIEIEALTLRIEALERNGDVDRLRKRIVTLEEKKDIGKIANNLEKLEKNVKLEHTGMSHRIEICEQQQGRSLNRLINNREGLEKVRERVGKLEQVVKMSAGREIAEKGPKPGEWW